MLKKKKNSTKNEDLMNQVPTEGDVELGDDVLETAAGGNFGLFDHGRVALAGVWPDNSRQIAYFNTRDEALEYAKKNGIR